MISRLRGTLLSLEPSSVEVETAGGVVYEVEVPLTVLQRLPPVGSTVELRTHQVVREDSVSLFGFLEAHDELQRRQARRMGINATDMQALRLLDLHGPMGPSTLARRLDLRSASTTVLIDRLEAAGYVERSRDADDRRRVTIRILPEAADVLFDTWAPVVRVMDEVGHGLSAAQQRAVCRFFDGLTAAIGAYDPGEPPESTRWSH